MIIGSGLLAKAMMPAFSNREDSVVYAAGVSNSHCVDPKEFSREASRLVSALNEFEAADSFIYFSTCSTYDLESVNTPYVLHKMDMENLVRNHKGYLIVRLPQVAGNTPNPHTLLNYLYGRLVRSERFSIWGKARRNIVDCSDAAKVVEALIEDNWRCKTVNVANNFDYSILEIVRVFELILNKVALYDLVDQGGAYSIDTSLTTSYANAVGVRFDETYLERILRKYYGAV